MITLSEFQYLLKSDAFISLTYLILQILIFSIWITSLQHKPFLKMEDHKYAAHFLYLLLFYTVGTDTPINGWLLK